MDGALSLGLISLVAVSLVLTLVSQSCSLRVLGRRRRTAHRCPPVSILKPLKGLDDGLYDNLAALARQDYPEFQIVFSIADEDDPALGVAKQIAADFPQLEIDIVTGAPCIGFNPKVCNLAHSVHAARHDLLLISDSNTRPDPGYLGAIVGELEHENASMVHNVLAGVGEKSLGGLLENMHLNSWVCCAVAGADLIAGRAAVVGKSMLFRRSVLDEVGGFHGVKDILAEDYVLGERFEAAGHRVVLSSEVVPTVNAEKSLKDFCNRHLRWGQMRRRICPPAFFAEVLLNPVPLIALAAGIGLALGLGHGWVVAVGALGLIGVKLLGDALLWRELRGDDLPWKAILWIPFKDCLVLALWFVASYRRKIVWRGNVMRIEEGSTLRRGRRDERDALEAL